MKATKRILQGTYGCTRKTAVLVHRAFGETFESENALRRAIGLVKDARNTFTGERLGDRIKEYASDRDGWLNPPDKQAA